MRSQGFRVLVVGAGMAGLAAARALHSWGATVEIVERTAEPSTRGTGINLPANGVRALAELGLDEQVRAKAVPLRRQRVSDRKGRLLFELDLADLWQDTGQCLALPRAELHEVLLSGAKEVPIRWDCSPETITTGQEVAVDFSDGTSGRYDLVLGADGVRSTVRRLVFGDDPGPRPVGQHTWRFLARWPDAPQAWSLWLAERSVVLTIPIGDGQVYCYCDTPDSPPPLEELLTGYVAPIPALLDTLESTVYSSANEEVVLDSWTRGAVLLVGDAAHATSPNMAQGAAMAFEDALVLRDSLASAADVAEALHRHETRRRRRTDWVLAQTHRRDAARNLPPRLRNLAMRGFGTRLFHSSHRPLRELP